MFVYFLEANEVEAFLISDPEHTIKVVAFLPKHFFLPLKLS